MLNRKKKNLTSSDVLNRLRMGEQAALSEIYKEHWEKLYDIALHLLGDNEQVEDVIHDVFISLWNIRKTLEVKVSLKAYLSSCTRFECYRLLRKAKKVNWVDFEQVEGEVFFEEPDNISFQELSARINTALTQVPQKSRIIFEMSREEELSYSEIANRTNLSTKSIEYHISKVLKVLRKAVGVFCYFI